MIVFVIENIVASPDGQPNGRRASLENDPDDDNDQKLNRSSNPLKNLNPLISPHITERAGKKRRYSHGGKPAFRSTSETHLDKRAVIEVFRLKTEG